MISLQIVDIKNFMNQLLISDTFDHFLLSEAVIKTNVSYTIDGHLNKEFYTADELEMEQLASLPAAPFSQLRPVCFHLIKGKKTPLSFHFTFQLSPANQENTVKSVGSSLSPSDVSAMFLHVRYQNNVLTCSTGISYRTFSLDRTLEQEYDSLMQRFFHKHAIAFELL